MTGTEPEVPEPDGKADRKSYVNAMLNILEDLNEERLKRGESQRALINMLEDLDTERARLELTPLR